MIQAICIGKVHNKSGVIIGYTLSDVNGATREVRSQDLKNAILSGQIDITNLKLTEDNKLVDNKAWELIRNSDGTISAKHTFNKTKDNLRIVNILSQVICSTGLPVKMDDWVQDDDVNSNTISYGFEFKDSNVDNSVLVLYYVGGDLIQLIAYIKGRDEYTGGGEGEYSLKKADLLELKKDIENWIKAVKEYN